MRVEEEAREAVQRLWGEVFARRTRADVGQSLAAILALANATDLISFSGGFPDPATFPGTILADLLRDLIESGDATALQYAPTAGLPGPRDFMASRLEKLEGHRPEPEELLVTSGAIECLELAGKALLDPDDLVLVEGPTYLGAIMAFRSFEAEVRPVPMDEGGLDVDALAQAMSERRPKFLYTIPDHQNPAGVSMAADRRQAVVDLARKHGVLVIEDVAYRELGFGREREDCLWAMGPDVVVQSGTFSKIFFPGVRLGWAAGPADVIEQLTLAKQNTDQCAGSLGQRLLEEYGRRGLLEEQNARAVALYRRRWEILSSALERHLPDGVEFTRPQGGFFTWLTLPEGADSVELAGAGMREKVAFVPGVPFYPDGRGRSNIRLAYSKVADEDIEEGARRLGALLTRGEG